MKENANLDWLEKRKLRNEQIYNWIHRNVHRGVYSR